jgi:hypothetical protein
VPLLGSDSLTPLVVANVSGGGGDGITSFPDDEAVEKPIVVAESEAVDGIRKVFIGGTDAMKFWLVKLVVADMIQYLSNHQVCHIWHAVNCYTICQARQP